VHTAATAPAPTTPAPPPALLAEEPRTPKRLKLILTNAPPVPDVTEPAESGDDETYAPEMEALPSAVEDAVGDTKMEASGSEQEAASVAAKEELPSTGENPASVRETRAASKRKQGSD
jgi:hypothetical protein